MIAGRGFWIVVWYVILLLGALSLWPSIYWGRRTQWRNLDELLRAIGTISVSVGMLLLLHRTGMLIGRILLALSLLAFILAFLFGRRRALAARAAREARTGEHPSSGGTPPGNGP